MDQAYQNADQVVGQAQHPGGEEVVDGAGDGAAWPAHPGGDPQAQTV